MDELYAALERMNQSYRESNGIYHEIAVALHLTDTMFYIFYALAEDYRPLDQHRLCTDWNLPKQTVNSAVANLVQKGLVYLEPGKGHSKYIRLSEAGRKIIKEKIEPIRRAECRALQQMTPEERRYLVALTDRYIGLLHMEMTREAEKFKRKGASEP